MCLTVTGRVVLTLLLFYGRVHSDENVVSVLKNETLGVENELKLTNIDLWKELLSIVRSDKPNQEVSNWQQDDDDDYVDLKNLFVNEEVESPGNETQNDAAYITEIRRHESWDEFLKTRDPFIPRGSASTKLWTSEDNWPSNTTLESMSLRMDDHVEEPIRGSSLAFVFDSTGSMHDELNQVKVGASKILAALRDHPDIPIHNYVLVPFNDPGIGPVTVTTDHKLFKERIEDIQVIGGGDCPEMTVGAIKKALEVSLPNSYIYVFTDASAKDARLQNEVLSLIQRKQAQVVFIMTDDCRDLSENSYQVYERISETSSGQVYRLSKSEVKEVLKYVKVALQRNVVNLLSQHKPAPRNNIPDEHEVMIDESLKQFTVSVSGTNASISVTDPKGQSVDGPPKLESLLALKNVKIVNVKEPDPGPWKVMINSDSDYTVKSTGLSGVHFNHGFSTVETTNLMETNHRPLKGATCYILIQTSDLDKVYNLTTVDIVGLNGETLDQFSLEAVPGVRGAFKGGGFVPPSTFFYLGITGFGKDGFPIKRITTTAISPQLPEKPFITMRSKTIGLVDTSEMLKCHVQSVVPFTVQWYKDGQLFGREQNYSQTCEAVLHINKLTLQSEGNFTCRASNVAGTAVKTTFLSVTGDPPSVKVVNRVVTSLGETVLLDCSVHSILPYSLSWSQFTAKNEHSGILHPVSKGVQLENDTLLMKAVAAEDEGWYVCTAVNKGGRSQGRIFLLVKDPLRVFVEPESATFMEGNSARLICWATGKPQPRIEWRKDQRNIPEEDPSLVTEEVNGKLNLVIDYLEKQNEGIYSCHAANSEEEVTATVELIYTERPSISAKENNIMVKGGSKAVLQCSATGQPKPSIKWLKSGLEISLNSRFQVKEDGFLEIESTRSVDAGEYSCVAENKAGTDTDYIGLFVGSSPAFLQKPRDKRIELRHNGTIPCSAIGMPPAEVKWSKLGGVGLDPERMFTLSSGALRIINVAVDDAGYYVCTAENIFGFVSSQVILHVTGIEKPTPDINIVLTDVKAVSGDAMTIPCGLVIGNPPGIIKWFKNGIEVGQNERVNIDNEGNLNILEVTKADRGDYECSATNVVGNSTRPYKIIVSESPKIIAEGKTDLRATKGGEIIVPCPAEGFPRPVITWMKDGLPLPMSSTIFQDDDGSLIIRNVTVESDGTYICTAINSVGSASKAISMHVQVPPVISEDTHDASLNIVEGHVVVLNCNVNAVPTPTIHWYKNDESLLRNEEKVHAQPEILRFVANVDDTGIYKCEAINEVGTAAKEFNVTILVPPNMPNRGEQESIKAKAGIPVTLFCNVYGFPKPAILWQRNGMYLTQNSSEVAILDSGLLVIQNVTKESSGAYICEAENMAGITQRIYYLQVNFPPKILEEVSVTLPIKLKEGEEYSLPCLVEGNPKPTVTWRKNGLPIFDYHSDLIILGDNTLVLLQVTRESTGLYKCEATNAEGSVQQEYEVEVFTPPSMVPDDYPTKLEVNEGDSLILTCPTSFSNPPPNIQWIKDGSPLNSLLQERSDEAQMKLSEDQRSLTIVEAHPSDNGNYSCIATNLAGRTDADFVVDVLMTPHFEEFNHIAHRTILTGGEVTLNCSVTGNPQPKVTWRKGNTPISPHNTPGVLVSLDKQHLIISNGKLHHTGTYICAASNKVNTKEREFYVSVLEAPRLVGSGNEVVDVIKGDSVTLHCPMSGVPEPTITWVKMGRTKKILKENSENLCLIKVDCEDDGIYACEATNTAGTRTMLFNVTVLEPPEIEARDITDELLVPLGGNLTLRCKTKGQPRPDITWLHNGHILNENHIRRRRNIEYIGELSVSDDGSASLSLSNITAANSGIYTVLASNKAGVVEKNFQVKVLVPPNMVDNESSTPLLVVHPLPVVLTCPVAGDPLPSVHWLKDDITLTEDGNLLIEGKELRIKMSNSSHSGNYSCVAINPAGENTRSFNVLVIEPPKVLESNNKSLIFLVKEDLTLGCNASGDGEPKFLWFHSSSLLSNSSRVTLLNNGQTLVITNLNIQDSGTYSCVVNNIAGVAETTYTVQVYKPPALINDSLVITRYKKVNLNHPFSLHCPFTGHPSPRLMWFKDGDEVNNSQNEERVQSGGTYLTVPIARPEDSGEYRCSAENAVGIQELEFKVDVIVAGDWTPWSDWSECSVSCGLGEQFRERICSIGLDDLDRRLLVDKSKCVGNDVDRRKCLTECQVDGSWSSWSNWTSCSQSCGKGTRKRYRFCYNPEPRNQGYGCIGFDNQEELCELQPCPIHGLWSVWSPWSACTKSCGGGIRQRRRQCDSPAPQHGGESCHGQGDETAICNKQKCPGNGIWLEWSEWSPCSESCGKGRKKRHRRCRPSRRGKTCEGENIEIEKCFVRSCHDDSILSSADLHVTGHLNGQAVDNHIHANIETLKNGRLISANMNDLLKQQNKWFPYSPFLLSPLSWNVAYETDDANNGYSLTNGNFFSQSDIQFATGEGFVVKHKGQGVDIGGALQVEIEVAGEVPLIEPHAAVVIKSLDQDLVQTGANSLYSSVQNDLDIEGQRLPFSWNSSIYYDTEQGTMPYLVEKLSMKDIYNVYNPETQNVSYSAYSAIGKKFEDNQCPLGLIHDPQHMHCKDVNECEQLEDSCNEEQSCQNTFGSYKCICTQGFTTSGAMCLDIDECSQDPLICSHVCHNTFGSFICSCPRGYFLMSDSATCTSYQGQDHYVDDQENRNADDIGGHSSRNYPIFGNRANFSAAQICPPGFYLQNYECKDYNECEDNRNLCGEDETCLNTRSSYQCLSTPCPPGFHRTSRSCMRYCNDSRTKCGKGTPISETVTFNAVTLSNMTPFSDILHLDVQGTHDLVKTKFRILDGEGLFRVRVTHSRGSLYALRELKRDTLFRVKAEGRSYDTNGLLLYTTEFVIFIVVSV